MSATISKPMLFSGSMIPRLQDDSKTQTRRVVNPQPELVKFVGEPVPAFVKELCSPGFLNVGLSVFNKPGNQGLVKVPHPIGSRIWVKETFGVIDMTGPPVFYRADNPKDYPDDGAWTPSIFMPRKFSRITLEVTQVRVERLQDISEEDAIAEGACPLGEDSTHSHAEHGLTYKYQPFVNGYRELWERINGKGSWDKNPWVWCYTFKRIKP